MLKIENIRKRYGQLEVLKGVNLEVKNGEIVSIVGASGAGKSTLLHIMGTLDDTDEGTLEINGVRIESRKKVDIQPVSWRRRLIGYLIDLSVLSVIFFTLLAVINFYYIQNSFTVVDENGIFESLSSSIFWTYLFPIIVTFLYYFLLESIAGRTVGKVITGTKIMVREEGVKPNVVKVFLRTLTRFFPFEIFSFLSKHPVGWHDSIVNIIVVNSQAPYSAPVPNKLSNIQLSEFRSRNIGFIFQFHNLLPEFTALENVCLPGLLGKRDIQEVENRAKELLGILGVAHRMDHKPSQLSGGEQQRVAVARALINNPSLVLADEPTGNLDSHNAEELHKLFFELRDSLGQTFIIVTHNEKLANMADRKLEIVDGRIS